MLKELHIKNIAVIDEVHIEFSEGFNVLTGETGAGKSILIDSINMSLGKRVSHDLIRTNCDKAVVNACFEVSDKEVLDKLSDFGIDCEDGILAVNRQLTRDGKSTCRINGITMPLGVVREITAMLIDIHGQNDNQSLLDSKKHLGFLDDFGNIKDDLEEYQTIYKKMREVKRQVKTLSASKEEKERRLELLNFQINEIDAAKLKIAEDEELEAKRDYLYNMESIVSGASNAYSALYGGEEYSAFDLLKKAERSMSEISRFSPRLSDCYERLSGIIAETQDIASEVSDCLSRTDFSMAELDAIEERIDTINTLKRKYGSSIDEILKYKEIALAEADSIEKSDESLLQLNSQLFELEKEIKELAEKLSKRRLEAAKELESQITNELLELDMPKVRFAIDVSDREDSDDTIYTESGKDEVCFLLSTNPGEDLKAMSKIASGGELSRIMLAVKSVLSDTDTQSTMIFDEIDTGVSGRAAQKIAEKLSMLAKKKQVFSITHLAQIASMADSHYLIKKTSTDERTLTSVTILDKEGRVEELSRIIGGVSVTELTRKSALEMLDMAKNKKES